MWICLSFPLFSLAGCEGLPEARLKEVVLSGIGGQSKPLREAGVLHVEAAGGKVKKILCYKFDQRVGNTDKILLLSLRTIRDANIDILHHMDQSLDGISSPLSFLKDKVVGRHKRKNLHGKARAADAYAEYRPGRRSIGLNRPRWRCAHQAFARGAQSRGSHPAPGAPRAPGQIARQAGHRAGRHRHYRARRAGLTNRRHRRRVPSAPKCLTAAWYAR